MKKSWIILLLFLAGCQQNNNTNRLIDLVPTNPILLIKNNNYSEKNLINFNRNLNKILNVDNDSILSKIGDSDILVSYHIIGKNKITPIIFSKSNRNSKFQKNIIDSIVYDRHIIKRIGNDNNFYYSTLKNGIHIESESKLLIENSIRNSNLVLKNSNNELEELYNISNSNITIFISKELKGIVGSDKLTDIINISKLSNWFQFDVELNKNGLTFNGLALLNDSIPKNISYLNGTKPSKSNLIDLVPNNFLEFERYSFNFYNYLENIEKTESITQIGKLKTDSLLIDINEFGTLNTVKDSIFLVNFKENEFLERKINEISDSPYNYRDYAVYSLKKNILNFDNLYFNDYKLKQNFASILGNRLIISQSKEEIERFIVSLSSNSTIIDEEGYRQLESKIPTKNNYLKLSNLKNIKSRILKNLDVSVDDFPYMINLITLDENLIYNTHSVLKNIAKPDKNKINLVNNFKIENNIISTPKFVTNYVTKKREIIFQDEENQLFLISIDGELIWKKDIGAKIIGEIVQVDLYKNGRLQYAFNTTEDFQIIDKNSNVVKKVKNKNKLGLSVFDYDKIKNYRFFLFDNNIKVINSKMRNVSGFSKKNLKGELTKSPKHFRIGSKDYLIFNENNKLIITDRRGNIRIENKLENINNEIFLNSNYFTTIDSENNIIKIGTDGKIIKNPLPLESKYLINADRDNLVYLSENILTINEKIIELKFGDYSKPKIFKTKSNDIISINDKQENKIYLFDSNANILPNFPIYGSSSIDYFEDKLLQKYITTLGEKNEILIYTIN